MESISPHFLALAKNLLPSYPIVCDVGSRDALEGIFLCRVLDAKQLHVFEPNPDAAAACMKNLEGVDDKDVFFNQIAVSDRIGKLAFYKDIGFSSLFQINPDYTKRRGRIVQKRLTVETTTLDSYFLGKQAPDLLWVDVEGAELLVLQGAKETLANVRLIHIEVSFRPMQIEKPLFWEVESFLKSQGFFFRGFCEISVLRGFLYRNYLLPNPPWRLNAIFARLR